ncbi:cysteine hydrolase family protein [Deinococcus sp. SL84]|uniref:cysteine hydrolase family protein n=1 Tax=Deinococcus sp. SL84 TaxID=2994663 RepID=UPI0022723021|nr:cysteine hydrolase [Deinococcus sp. SL84]MCY1703533.1 cysteine hydrolase [Deinococcus sp. SL84]
MPVTKLEPKTALIAVDVQKGTLGMSAQAEAERVVGGTVCLADAFHASGLPVVWVRAVGLPRLRTDLPLPPEKVPGDFSELHPSLPVQDGDLVADKFGTSALVVPEVRAFLQERGVKGVVVTGLATGMGVESTVRAAFDAGYHVTVASDAVTDPNTERGQNSLRLTLPGFAEVGTVEEILNVLSDKGGKA